MSDDDCDILALAEVDDAQNTQADVHQMSQWVDAQQILKEPMEKTLCPYWQSVEPYGLLWLPIADPWSPWSTYEQGFFSCAEAFQEGDSTSQEKGTTSASDNETSESDEAKSARDLCTLPSPRKGSEITPPPGVFFNAPLQHFHTLADIVIPGVVSCDQLTHGWDWWHGHKATDWETTSEISTSPGLSEFGGVSTVSSRGRRRNNAPVYVGEHLAWLESKDANCVCIVKRIHKLGRNAASILREYFGQWGPVEKVLLSNAPADSPAVEPVIGTRVRPSGIGWVVMTNAEDTANALSHSHHEIEQVLVTVDRFVSRGQTRRRNKIAEVVEENEVDDAMLANIVAGEDRKRWSDMLE